MRLLLTFTRSHCFIYLLSHLLFISSSATLVKNTSKADVSKFRNGVAVTDTANCKLVPSQRYPGLFVSSSKLRRVTTNSSVLFSDSYQIRSVLTRIPVNISTESSWGTTTTTSRPNFRITGDPCCTTTMSMTVPSTVSPKYNLQQEYTVKQLASSYQIIHESQCANPGAACTLSGVCKLAYRVQWVLVEGYDGSDMFIPVEVGNHCYCQYR
ncbi:hypothetical protein BgiBS90_020266 [Biomphalaria glabrata]|nr:hypothetical protein BgiBS90_020266 [Biomphalaria glabrata]